MRLLPGKHRSDAACLDVIYKNSAVTVNQKNWYSLPEEEAQGRGLRVLSVNISVISRSHSLHFGGICYFLCGAQVLS